MCNGNTLLDDFNIYREVGSLHMTRKSFSHIKPTAQGKLNLTFEPISNYVTVSAIKVIDESNSSSKDNVFLKRGADTIRPVLKPRTRFWLPVLDKNLKRRTKCE